MQVPALTKKETAGLAALAVFGLAVPNGIFVWCFFRDPGLLRAAFANPISLTFILEALILLVLFAWLIARAGLRRPSALVFAIMSLVGSLAFSVPATLHLVLKNPHRD